MKKIILLLVLIIFLGLSGCTKKTYQVELYIDNQLFDSFDVNNGAAIGELPTASKDGYLFIGWKYNNIILTENFQVNKDIKAFASFELGEKSYKVTFIDFDESIIEEQEVLEYQDATPPEVSREGYTFNGWDRDYTFVSEDITVMAKYKAINYSIKYYYGSSEIKTISPKNYNIETEVILANYNISGYNFVGWYLEPDLQNPITKIEKGQTGDITVYAKMEIIKVLELELDFSTMKIGETQNIKISAHALNTGISKNLSDYIWSSSNSNIASISNDGVIEALNVGIVTIQGSLDNLVATITLNIVSVDSDPFDAVNNSVILNSSVTREMTNPYYWLNKMEDIDKVLMTKAEIDEYNYKCLNNIDPFTSSKTTGFIDITKISSITKAEVQSLINASINAAPSAAYNSNCNLNNLPSTIDLKFGLMVNVASMKNVPTLASTGTNNKYQETGLEVGEAVVVYHTSSDGLWYFVQAYNYYGWILKSDVALCSRAIMLDYFTTTDFVIVTAERLKTPVDIRMGTKLPISNLSGKQVSVKVPTRDSDGNLVMTYPTYTIANENMHVGYLPYTTKSLVKQMFKMLGQPYDWGDEHGGRDCSSTLDAAYKCFGFLMPRNTSSLVNLNGQRYNLQGKTDAQKADLLKTLRPGTIVLKSGHVMMYVGYEGANCYIIHNVSGGVNISTCTHSSAPINTYTLFIEMFN